MSIIKFMVGGAGRIARIIAGIVLIALGLGVIGETTGLIVAIIGVLPLVAGIFDFCIFAPLFKLPLSGPQVRRRFNM